MFILTNIIQRYKKKEFLNIKNYSFPSKGFVLIKGPNGCGKTTLLKTMLGLLSYEGNIYFQNKDIREWKEELFTKVCYVPQFNTLLDDLTLEENLKLNNVFLNQARTNYPTTKKIKKLSGGQQKQANLERCKFFDFDCYILDEPTTSLDKKKKQELIEFIKLEKENKLIICVSHDEALDQVADQIVFMDKNMSSLEDNVLPSCEEEIKKEPKKIPLKFYFKIFKEDKLLTFFKFSSTFLLLVLFFILFHVYNINERNVDSRYAKNILNYAYVLNEEKEEEVYEDFILGNSCFDMVGFSMTTNIPFIKDNESKVIPVRSIYFSKEITEAIVSDVVIESNAYRIVLKNSLEEQIISIASIEKTNKELLEEEFEKNFYNYSYIILPSSCLENYFESYKNYVHFVISKEDNLPSGYRYHEIPSDYWYLSESYFFPRIILIAGIILVGSIFVYVEIVSFVEKKNKVLFEQKLKIFGVDEFSLHKVLYLKEAIILGISFILSVLIGILIMYFWISKYTAIELKRIGILSTPIHYEFISILFVISFLLFLAHYLIIRRKL